MRRLTEAELSEYKENGYLIVKDVIDTKVVDEMMDFVAHVISLECGDKSKVSKLSKDQILNDALIKLKKENPSSSSWIYQTILSSYALKKFFVKSEVSELAMQLLNIQDENNLGTVSPAFRFDIPGDVRNVRTWHQDSSYFLENEKGHEHLVTWIPMNKATKDNGSVIIAKDTHKVGRLDREHVKAAGFSSEQYTTDDKFFNDAELDYIEAGPGDIAFINMDLIHKSGENITTDEVRYTAQIRFNTINKETYRPVFLKPEYPEYNRTKELTLD